MSTQIDGITNDDFGGQTTAFKGLSYQSCTMGGRSARVVRPPREPYPQTFDSEEPDLLVLSYPRMADCSKPDLAESHDQWRGEPGSGSITAELLPLPSMNAPQQ